MGAPKQKWTSEEEASLKAGIAKHGPGRWSTILKDPEFGSVLRIRSNVDLKDKWRNLQSMAGGCGSRQRAKPAKPKTQLSQLPENISIAIKEEQDMQICLPEPPTPLAGMQNGSSKMPMPRLDSLILEAIANLKESCGCSRAAIAAYIKDKHPAPPKLGRLLKAELKNLIDGGKLIEVKHRYRIAPPTSNSDIKPNTSSLLQEGKQECSPMSTIKILTKAEIDVELEKMWSMTPQQAAAMAMKAVAEAEAAISEAERAAREAEAAEADAKLAKVYAAAAMRALKRTTLCT